jgi:site-specific DNA-methyltransferase (adenine-specific)
MMQNKLLHGDCFFQLDEIPDNSVDLIYIDPPFFSQKAHSLSTRNGEVVNSFSDKWQSSNEYCVFIKERLLKMRDKLKQTGSLFFHCDNNASHLIRLLLDEVLGSNQFRSKIVWTYKRWSNAKKGLLPAYQEIFFYSKSSAFHFNKTYGAYSSTTNVDQILQKRERDSRGKSVYAKTATGEIVSSDEKLGVPLSDVWEIPFLNPKAAERVGYPTQKPILLLERIIQLTTSEGDVVLDPFCGSGTTLVASKLLNRQFVGIDSSEQALLITQKRLNNPVKTASKLFEQGKDAYQNADNPISSYLSPDSYNLVQRNRGIDAILKTKIQDKLVLVRVQRQTETIAQATLALLQATQKKINVLPVLIVTMEDGFSEYFQTLYPTVFFVKSLSVQLSLLTNQALSANQQSLLASAL